MHDDPHILLSSIRVALVEPLNLALQLGDEIPKLRITLVERMINHDQDDVLFLKFLIESSPPETGAHVHVQIRRRKAGQCGFLQKLDEAVKDAHLVRLQRIRQPIHRKMADNARAAFHDWRSGGQRRLLSNLGFLEGRMQRELDARFGKEWYRGLRHDKGVTVWIETKWRSRQASSPNQRCSRIDVGLTGKRNLDEFFRAVLIEMPLPLGHPLLRRHAVLEIGRA